VGALVEAERVVGSRSGRVEARKNGRVEARGGSGGQGDARRRVWTRTDGDTVLCPVPPRRALDFSSRCLLSGLVVPAKWRRSPPLLLLQEEDEEEEEKGEGEGEVEEAD
jgi:hypothetical protein